MGNKNDALKILEFIGGPGNIKSFVNCMTRLRFNVIDKEVIDDDKIKELSTVIGTAENGQQYQVIVGGNNVDKMSKAIKESLNEKADTASIPQNKKKDSDRTTEDKSIKGVLLRALNVLSEILTPLVPALAATGMLKVLLLLATQFGVVSDTDTTYQILEVISDSCFYFMPILTAFLAADYFKTDRVIASVLAGVLLHPGFSELFLENETVKLLYLPVTEANYSGTIIPSILMVIVMKKVDEIAGRIVPEFLKVFLQPLVVTLVVSFITVLVIGPIGLWLGDGFGYLVTELYEKIGWLGVGVLGATLPFTVLTGLNRALTPISIQIFNTLGHEPLFRTAYIAGNMTVGASALAIAVKTKRSELKQVAYSAGTTTLLTGITEPSLFGVLLHVKKSLVCTTIAGFFGGAYAGFTGVSGYALAVPGLLSIPMFIGETSSNLINALISYGISIIGAFVLTYLFVDVDQVKG